MSWSEAEIPIEDSRYFKTLNGLWTGKKPPFKQAGVIRNTNFTSAGKIDYSKIAYLEVEEKQLANRKLEPGDIIIERSGGGPKQPVGRVVFFDQIEGEFSFSNFTSAIRVSDKQSFEPKFVFYRLLELYQSGRTEDIQRRTTGIRNLDFTAYKQRARIPKIPLEEQRSIVHILATVQRAIEAQQSIIQTTMELKQALMQKLFSEGLRAEPQKETEIGLVPESWEVVPLSEICQFLSGGTPSKQNPEFWQGSIPWVSPKDMKRPRLQDAQDHISQEGLESGSKLAPAGSVLVVVRGMILAKTVPVALAEVPVAINQDMKAIVPGPKLSSDYLLYALEAFRENLFKRVGRSGHGTCTLMGHEVSAAKIPLPDIKTQEAIAHAIRSLENKRELHGFKLSLAKQLFQTLLSELINGSTREQDSRSLYLIQP